MLVGRGLGRTPIQSRISCEIRRGCPFRSYKCPRTKTAQPPWAACTPAWLSSGWKLSLNPVWVPLAPTCACCLSSAHRDEFAFVFWVTRCIPGAAPTLDAPKIFLSPGWTSPSPSTSCYRTSVPVPTIPMASIQTVIAQLVYKDTGVESA